jgi:hypothetical protein
MFHRLWIDKKCLKEKMGTLKDVFEANLLREILHWHFKMVLVIKIIKANQEKITKDSSIHFPLRNSQLSFEPYISISLPKSSKLYVLH